VLYSHALSPEALLKVYRQFYQQEPPAVFILGVCGECFELGEGLSVQAAERLAAALEFSKKLINQPTATEWEYLCTH
jgi:hypothetical protein